MADNAQFHGLTPVIADIDDKNPLPPLHEINSEKQKKLSLFLVRISLGAGVTSMISRNIAETIEDL